MKATTSVFRLKAALCAAAILAANFAGAAVNIVPVYDASFIGNANFTNLQATVNNAIAIYSSSLGNNLTLPVNFVLSAGISGAQSSYALVDVLSRGAGGERGDCKRRDCAGKPRGRAE